MAIVGTLGSKAVIKGILGENQTPTLDFAAGHGMATYTFTRPRQTITVAGTGDHLPSETTDRRLTTLAFTVNDDDDTRVQLLMKHGRLFSLSVSEEGEASGSELITFNARAAITHTIPAEGAATFGVTFTADGAVTVGTHA